GVQTCALPILAPRWSIPEDLQAAIDAFGHALLAGEVARVRAWLLSDVAWPGLAEGLPAIELHSQRVVAFAKLGQKRVVKLRLEGSGMTAALGMRWALTTEGWRSELVEVRAVAPVRPD